MTDDTNRSEANQRFRAKVEETQKRKLRAKRQGDRTVWFGLGMFGLVGWSVAIPVLAFVALGIWIDSRTDSQYSWTLMFLMVGVVIGCLNAWFWICRERKSIEEDYHQDNGNGDMS